MTGDWIKLTYETIVDQTVVTPGPLIESFHHLRTIVPSLEIERDESGQVQLLWHEDQTCSSEQVDACFWNLIAAADGADAELIQFAERFGPLIWNPGAQDSGTDTAETGRKKSWREPLWAWRDYARGLRSLFASVDARGVCESIPIEQWTSAVATVAIPLILHAGALPNDPPTEEDFLAILSQHLLDGAHGHSALLFDQIVTATLRIADVGMAFVYENQSSTTVFAIPATVSQPGGAFRDKGIWQVRGLLPVLAIALAIELRDSERGLCTWCGKPAGIIRRRRRRGDAWFGDHDQCRAQALSVASRRAKVAYRKRRKAAKSA